MANDINSVIINGRLTRDAELKYTGRGTAMCRFSLAVNRGVKRVKVLEILLHGIR
jgi:single-strand DNA-binding protein